MFNGEESIRIDDKGGDDKTFDFVEEELSGLGNVSVTGRGSLRITPRGSFDNAFAKTTMDGTIRQRKSGEYDVTISYSCTLSTVGWVVFILGILLFLLGLLVIIAPMMLKGEASRKVRRELDGLE